MYYILFILISNMSCPKNFGEEIKLPVSDTDGSEEKNPEYSDPVGIEVMTFWLLVQMLYTTKPDTRGN